MNKNLKKIIAITLAVGTISAAAPAANISILTTKTYASDNSETTLNKLELENSNGDSINIYSDDDYKSSHKVDYNDVERGDTYYARTSSQTVQLDINGPSSRYVRVFNGTRDSTKGKSVSRDIDLSSGTNTLTVRVYDSEPDDDIRYDDNSYESEYTLKVKYTGDDSNSDDSADSYDDIYLNRLSVDDDDISLSDSKVKYNYTVASNVDEVTVRAKPEYSDYDVEINGHDVNDDDRYKKSVSLDNGDNEIKIKIDEDDKERVYTLNINRGGTTTTSQTNTATSQPSNAGTVTSAADLKVDQWVQVNGGWQYHDSLGTPIKGVRFLDRNLGKWYYLGADGMMVSNCWILDGGKYYYFYADGSMAINTWVGPYKVGGDGAWIH